MSSSAIITVQEVHKSFGPRLVLDGVSFAVHEGDRIGLIGINGCGKSTLLRLCAAAREDADPADTPDAGLITRRRDLGIDYVPQEPRLAEECTVADVLREGLAAHQRALDRLRDLGAEITALTSGDGGPQAGSPSATADAPRLHAALHEQAALHERMGDLGGWDREHELRGIAAALKLPPQEALIGALSIGERRRVALGRALLAQPEVLMLDEPTNHLDARTVAWLEERLLGFRGTLLLVTHDRYFLDRVATRILELDRGQLYSYEGGYTRFLEKQAERLEDETTQRRARASFIRNELSWIRRGPQARGTKQKARIDRFNAAVQDAADDRDKAPGEARVVLELPTGGRIGKTILELRGVGKSLGGKRLFSDLTLTLKPGDRIGVVGDNGMGKTTLMRTLLGLIPPDEGEVVVGHNTRIAFLSQERVELHDERTVLEEVSGDNEFVYLAHGPVHVRTFLRMLLFDDRFADTPVGVLSGGERNRVQLAKLLRQGGNLLCLDEPTNDLDLLTLGVLEEALCAFPGCAIIVSHDRWFLDRVATGILAFEGQGRVVFHEGNFSAYRERVAQAADEEPASQAAARPAPRPAAESPASKKGPRRLSYREQQELSGMEDAILAAEGRVTQLQGALADPALYKDRAAGVPGLVADLDRARAAVEALYARWQELESIARG